MEIRFISSLTAEDEDLFAPAVLRAVSALLDQFPIAYTLRIETTGARVLHHTHVAPQDVGDVLQPNTDFLSAGTPPFQHSGNR
jgi:hypothetical protein